MLQKLERFQTPEINRAYDLQLIMEEKRFATVMWGGCDFIVDGNGADPARQEWLMECTGLQASFMLPAVLLKLACHRDIPVQVSTIPTIPTIPTILCLTLRTQRIHMILSSIDSKCC